TLPDLPPSVTLEVLYTLETSMPPPVGARAEEREARMEMALAMVAALHPADAFEASLAAQVVAADAHAKDCLRLAVGPEQDAETARRCRGQAAAMMRLMQSGLRALQRTQAMREASATSANPAEMERAGWWFRDVSTPLPAAT